MECDYKLKYNALLKLYNELRDQCRNDIHKIRGNINIRCDHDLDISGKIQKLEYDVSYLRAYMKTLDAQIENIME